MNWMGDLAVIPVQVEADMYCSKALSRDLFVDSPFTGSVKAWILMVLMEE
jgi:hypothetical protein